MIFAYIIGIVSSTIWLLIPLRQLKTNYFYYFLTYAIPASLTLINAFFPIDSRRFLPGLGLLTIISLFNFKKIPNYQLFLSGIVAISIYTAFIIQPLGIIIVSIVEHVIILLIILKKAILFTNSTKKINYFHILLILFEVSVITRFIPLIGEKGLIFFYITAALGIFIGIFFLIYNEETSPQYFLEKNIT